MEQTDASQAGNPLERILVPTIADIVEGGRHTVPADLLRRFGAHHVGDGIHVHCGASEGLADQLYVHLDGCSRLNPERRKKENSAGTDIGCLQGVPVRASLSCYTLQKERQRKPGTSVGSSFVRATHGMRGYTVDSAWLLVIWPIVISGTRRRSWRLRIANC